MRAKEGVDQRFMKSQSGYEERKREHTRRLSKKNHSVRCTHLNMKKTYSLLCLRWFWITEEVILHLYFTLWWTMTKMADESEVCVWLSEDKKISQSLQQKQQQSGQDEDDSLL